MLASLFLSAIGAPSGPKTTTADVLKQRNYQVQLRPVQLRPPSLSAHHAATPPARRAHGRPPRRQYGFDEFAVEFQKAYETEELRSAAAAAFSANLAKIRAHNEQTPAPNWLMVPPSAPPPSHAPIPRRVPMAPCTGRQQFRGYDLGPVRRDPNGPLQGDGVGPR